MSVENTQVLVDLEHLDRVVFGITPNTPDEEIRTKLRYAFVFFTENCNFDEADDIFRLLQGTLNLVDRSETIPKAIHSCHLPKIKQAILDCGNTFHEEPPMDK